MALLLPKRVFLDTNHLVNISRFLEGADGAKIANSPERASAYKRIMEMLREGSMSLVITREQVLEWCRGEPKLAYSIARVLDLSNAVFCVPVQNATFLIEIARECQAQTVELSVLLPELPEPLLAPSRAFSLLKLTRASPIEMPFDLGLLIGTVKFDSARDLVESQIRAKQYDPMDQDEWQRQIDENFAFTKRQSKGEKGFSSLTRWDWLERNLCITRAIATIVRTMPPDEWVEKIRLDNCSSFDLFCRVQWEFFQAKTAMTPNDHADLCLVHAVPYADLSCLERGLCGLIRNTKTKFGDKVCHDPVELIHRIN